MSRFENEIFLKFKNWIYAAHLMIVLVAIYYLINDIYSFLNMETRISSVDESFHVCSFAEFLEKSNVYITKSITGAMWVVLILLVATGIMFFKDMAKAIMLHVIALGLSTVIGVAYIVLNIDLGIARFVDNGWKCPFFIILLVLGAILTIGGIVILAKEKQLSIKKPICVVCLLGMIVGMVIVFLYPYVSMKKANKEYYEEVMYYVDIIDARRDGYDETIEYQIGNYCGGNALYVNETLYIRGTEKAYPARIYTLDNSGKYELFWEAHEKSWFASSIYYYKDYIYVGLWVDNEETPYKLIRISMSDGSEEIVLTEEPGTDDVLYGIAGDKLYYFVYYDMYDEYYIEDNPESKRIYYIDLDGEISKDNAVLYDDGVWFSLVAEEMWSEVWVNAYLYNQFDKVTKNVQAYKDDMYFLLFDTSGCGYLRKNTNDNLVEYNVEQYNIFNDHMYFVKNFKDYFELWRCDMDGEDKTLIGTVTPKQTEYNNTENDGCVGLYLAEDFAIIDFDDGVDSINERYIMLLDDGSVMEIVAD